MPTTPTSGTRLAERIQFWNFLRRQFGRQQLRRRWPSRAREHATASVANCDGNATLLENLYDVSFGTSYDVNSAGNIYDVSFGTSSDVNSAGNT